MSHFKLRSTLPIALAGLVSLSLSTGVMAQKSPAKPVRSSGVSTLRKANPVQQSDSTIHAVAVPDEKIKTIATYPSSLNLPTEIQDLISKPGIRLGEVPLDGLGVLTPHTATDPVLYSQRTQIVQSNGIATTQAYDFLFGFPALGFNNQMYYTSYIGNTMRSDAVAPNNRAFIVLGNIGNPATITRVRIGGTTFDSSGNQVSSSYNIVVFDGVDFASPTGTSPYLPSNAKIAKTASGANAIFTASITYSGSNTFGTRSFDFAAATQGIKITDPNGRFGIMVASIVDNTNFPSAPADTVWGAIIGVANGPNLAYRLTGGSFSNPLALTTFFAGSDLNQGAFAKQSGNNYQTVSNFNYYMALHGLAADGVTIPSRGNLDGSVRLQGVDVPANLAPEPRPRNYTLSFYTPATTGLGTFVTSRSFFNQPSYDASGKLLRNFRVDGLPTGTYDVVVSYSPADGLDSTNNVISESITTSTQYPGADFYASIYRGITITSAGPVSATDNGAVVDLLSATPPRPFRLVRYGDISDASGAAVQDGKVDVNDLFALLSAFNSTQGDGTGSFESFPTADLAGPSDANYADRGAPNGKIDVDDLFALLSVFNTGQAEN